MSPRCHLSVFYQIVRCCAISATFNPLPTILSEGSLCACGITDDLDGGLTQPAPGLPFGGGGTGPAYSMDSIFNGYWTGPFRPRIISLFHALTRRVPQACATVANHEAIAAAERPPERVTASTAQFGCRPVNRRGMFAPRIASSTNVTQAE